MPAEMVQIESAPYLVEMRRMTFEDIPRLVEMDALSNRPPWTEKMFEQEFELPFSLPVVATLNENLVGFGIVWLIHDTGQLIQCAVAPEQRRNGIGWQLLNYLMGTAQKKGCKKMELEFREGNLPAKKLYEKMGFKIVGKRKGFYDGCDGILMTCDLK